MDQINQGSPFPTVFRGFLTIKSSVIQGMWRLLYWIRCLRPLENTSCFVTFDVAQVAAGGRRSSMEGEGRDL